MEWLLWFGLLAGNTGTHLKSKFTDTCGFESTAKVDLGGFLCLGHFLEPGMEAVLVLRLNCANRDSLAIIFRNFLEGRLDEFTT